MPSKHRPRPQPVDSPGSDVPARPEPDPFVEMLVTQDDFRVDVLSSDGVHRVVLRGELDLLGAPILWQRIVELCEGPTVGLRLDLRRLTFMDSSGLHVVLDTRALCESKGFDFAITDGSPPVRRLFEVSGLRGLLATQRP
jgi:anti-sigma B factor antagonist